MSIERLQMHPFKMTARLNDRPGNIIRRVESDSAAKEHQAATDGGCRGRNTEKSDSNNVLSTCF